MSAACCAGAVLYLLSDLGPTGCLSPELSRKPKFVEIGQRKQKILSKVGETIVGIAPKIEVQFVMVSYCRGYNFAFPGPNQL